MKRKDRVVDLIFQLGLNAGTNLDRLIEYCTYLCAEVQPYGFNNTVLETKSDLSSYQLAFTLFNVQFGGNETPQWYKDYQITPPPTKF